MDTQYLRSNVAECLTYCLSELAIARPSDPIKFLAQAMLQWKHDRDPQPPPPPSKSAKEAVKYASAPKLSANDDDETSASVQPVVKKEAEVEPKVEVADFEMKPEDDVDENANLTTSLAVDDEEPLEALSPLAAARIDGKMEESNPHHPSGMAVDVEDAALPAAMDAIDDTEELSAAAIADTKDEEEEVAAAVADDKEEEKVAARVADAEINSTPSALEEEEDSSAEVPAARGATPVEAAPAEESVHNQVSEEGIEASLPMQEEEAAGNVASTEVDAAAPVATDIAAPVAPDEAAVTADDAAPVATDDAAPVTADGAASVTADDATPVASDDAAPVASDEIEKKLADQEGPASLENQTTVAEKDDEEENREVAKEVEGELKNDAEDLVSGTDAVSGQEPAGNDSSVTAAPSVSDVVNAQISSSSGSAN